MTPTQAFRGLKIIAGVGQPFAHGERCPEICKDGGDSDIVLGKGCVFERMFDVPDLDSNETVVANARLYVIVTPKDVLFLYTLLTWEPSNGLGEHVSSATYEIGEEAARCLELSSTFAECEERGVDSDAAADRRSQACNARWQQVIPCGSVFGSDELGGMKAEQVTVTACDYHTRVIDTIQAQTHMLCMLSDCNTGDVGRDELVWLLQWIQQQPPDHVA